MDKFDKQKRSDIMSKISGKNTKPEIIVRKLLHRMGYRFRLHRKDLPGTPDIVLPKYKKVIFIHGCFWHGHDVCKKGKLPETNREFWAHKIKSNIIRDECAINALKEMRWQPLLIWGCEIKQTNMNNLINKIEKFLNKQEAEK